MGVYLDRLNSEYAEVVGAIDSTINRAADENRDVSEDENKTVERGRERLGVLKSEIEKYAAIEREHDEVNRLRAATPSPTRTAVTTKPDEFDIERAFPTVADWAITVHRAMVKRDPEAVALLDRATAHQTTADNPGLIPRPILGPVLNFIRSQRPFIRSITNRPLTAPKFDRPVVTQHVAVGVQAQEKTLTESQKMLIGTLPVAASTYAGHLNISRQDIKWTSPGILQIVFDDFSAIYANVTNKAAADEFTAGLGAATVIDDWAGFNGAIYGGAQNSLAQGGVFPDTLWVSPDVWVAMGSQTNPTTGLPVFPSLSVTSEAGNPLGLRLVVDAAFAAGTMVMGPAQFAEWYEDVDALLQVGEPDVLGQLVGYAGYGAFLNVRPQAFTVFTAPTPEPPAAVTASKSSDSK
jgi:hypothetical protein